MKPIRNRKDLDEARKNLRELRGELGMLRQAYRHDPAAYREASRGLRQLVRETRRAIESFRLAQGGRLPAVVSARDPEGGRMMLGRVLRLLRQAAQLSQAALAERVGTKQANISRWERDDYRGYSLRHLEGFAEALGYELEVSFRRRRAQKGRSG